MVALDQEKRDLNTNLGGMLTSMGFSNALIPVIDRLANVSSSAV